MLLELAYEIEAARRGWAGARRCGSVSAHARPLDIVRIVAPPRCKGENVKHLAALALITLASACTSIPSGPRPPSPPMVSVFAVAHQDDWQLFMNPDAYHAMNEPQEKAVFIHVTAGDAGAGPAASLCPIIWRARRARCARCASWRMLPTPRWARAATMDSAMVDTRWAWGAALRLCQCRRVFPAPAGRKHRQRNGLHAASGISDASALRGSRDVRHGGTKRALRGMG